VHEKLTAARNFASSDNPQAIAFSAPTGSGKTLVMTARFAAIRNRGVASLQFIADLQDKQADGS